MRNKTSRFEKILTCLLLAFLCLCIGLKYYVVLTNPMPKELRETTLLYYAQSFAKGQNPYTASALLSGGEIPGATNVYGFLAPLLLSLFVRLLPFVSVLQVCEGVTLAAEVAGCWFFFRALCCKTHRTDLSLLGTILLYGCYWRYTACGGAFPDSIGVALLCVLLYCCTKDEETGVYHPVVYAVLIICLFYIKQYFVFALPGLVVWQWFHSRRDFFRLFLAGMGLGCLSLAVVQLTLPLYFTLTLAVAQGTTAVYDLPYSLRQILSVGGKRYLVITLLCAACACTALRQLIRERTVDLPGLWKAGSLSFGVWEALCSLPFVIYIAQNHGTEYTYYLQLWWPWVIFCGTVFAALLLCRWQGAVPCAATTALCVLALFQSRSYTVAHIQTRAEQEAWQAAYAYLDAAAAEGEILAAAQLANYCMEHDIPTGDYGQAEYNDELNYNAYKSNALWCRLFPLGEDILVKNLTYHQQIRKNLAAHRYQLVAITANGLGSYLLTPQEVEAAGYHLSDRLVLVTGEQRWETLFYTKEV